MCIYRNCLGNNNKFIKMKNLIFPIIFLTSCVSEVNREKKIYIIKQGNHFSDFSQTFVKDISEYSANVIFDSSAIYQFGTETSWNKLFGFAFFEGLNNPVHEESARWVWRWNQGLLQLSPYCYVDGKVAKNKITITRQLNREIPLKITKYDNSYQFYVDNVLVHTETFTHKKKNGYLQRPYFGGERTAPHNVTIIFYNLTIK